MIDLWKMQKLAKCHRLTSEGFAKFWKKDSYSLPSTECYFSGTRLEASWAAVHLLFRKSMKAVLLFSDQNKSAMM